MIEKFKVLLRGKHNSIRYRFLVLPKEWLEYLLLFRLRGKSWIDFYSTRLNRAQNINANKPIPEEYISGGKFHLEFLKSQGLRPSHKLLDYGCGICRSGIYFAKYLDKKNYVGVDITQERLKKGRELFLQSNINLEDINLFLVDDCHLSEINHMKFDYIFANSVVTHMPTHDIVIMLSSMKNILSENGTFLFTFAEADTPKRENIKDFWYTRKKIQSLCENAGFQFSTIDEWPEEDTMARISIAN